MTAQDITDHWHAQFHELLRNGSVTSGGLRDLVTVLQRLADTSAPLPLTVRNDITGGVQHGPVIQAGRITGLTFRDRGPDTPEGVAEPGRVSSQSRADGNRSRTTPPGRHATIGIRRHPPE